MSEPVYQLVIARGDVHTEGWYQLSKEEQDRIWAETQAADERVGAEYVLFCNSRWANEGTPVWGIVKYPSIEAVQQVAAQDLEWFRYTNFETILGTKMPETPEP